MEKKISSPLSSDDLRAIVREKKISLGKLSSEINYSVTTLSLWLRGIYPNDATLLECAILRWASAQNLSPRDRRKFAYITDLLDNAENKHALLCTILRSTTSRTNKAT